MIQVLVDNDKCIASGACVLANPDVFDQDDDGIVILREEFPDEAQRAETIEAVGACPAIALRLVES